jgi:predicted DNA-binding WGR domain protein
MPLLKFKRISPEIAAPKPPAPEVAKPIPPFPTGKIGQIGRTPTSTTPSPNTSATSTSSGTTLYKKSDSGVGFKQWSVSQRGRELLFKWGKVGKTQQELTKTYTSDAAATAYYDRIVYEKRQKGYRDKM